MPHGVFNIVTKHPKEQHITAQMPNIGMDEGVGNSGEKIEVVRDELIISGQGANVIADRWNMAKSNRQGTGGTILRAKRQVYQKYDDVQRNDAERNPV